MKPTTISWQKIVGALRLTLIFATMFCSNLLFADGSKDLYPSGVSGYRAYLRSSTTATENWPYPNQGFHYVYAKAGERITLASSSQNMGSGRIRLYSPTNVLVVNNTSTGNIADRTAELAGPQLSGGSVSGRYTPIYYLVPSGGEGIYRVEMVARGTGDTSTTVLANNAWSQGNDNGIMAWDISVINTANTAFIPGRVYSNVLNLNNGTGSPSSNGFYGILYPLTKDGYTYRVKNNGNSGMFFTFFVNNNGFLDAATQNPVYKSLNGSSPSFLAGKVHDPNAADTAKNITHKMFYTLPAADLPVSSVGAVPGGSTWLKNSVVTPHVTNIGVVGVEGTAGQVSKKGGYIKFDADVQGNYTIVITGGGGFVSRTLTGPSSAGTNQIYWDAKDGGGNNAAVGTYPLNITVKLQGAEVHFPYIDMEYNKNGTIVELLDNTNLANVSSDIVYWNDTDIPNVSGTAGSNSSPKNNSHLPPTNSTGISSNSNGHKWGVGGTASSGTFGDVKAMDTWTFIAGEQIVVNASVDVKSADLMVSSVTPDVTNVMTGEQVEYTIKVKNGGVSDVSGAKFTFKVPPGYSPVTEVFAGNSCGSESTVISYDTATNTYTSNLNLPNGCEITYTIKVVVNSAAVAGNTTVTAAILRTNDVTDPDATNPNILIPPTDAQYECTNNGLGGACNNIKVNDMVIITLVCYNNPSTATGLPTKHGITLLKRAGATNGNWPMNRNSAHTVLESNTKGFVITRMTSDPAQTSAANHLNKITTPVEGMMVYDLFSKCLKIYADGAWKCFSKPACP